MTATATTTATTPSLEVLPACSSQDESVSSLSLDESESWTTNTVNSQSKSPSKKGILKTSKKHKQPTSSSSHHDDDDANSTPQKQQSRAPSRKRGALRGARSLSFKALSFRGLASEATPATSSTKDLLGDETATLSTTESSSVASVSSSPDSPQESKHTEPSRPPSSRRRRPRPFLSRTFSGRSLSFINTSSRSIHESESTVLEPSEKHTQDKHSQEPAKKSVSFQLPENITHTVPSSSSSSSSLYYSKNDYKKYAAQAQALADSATWKCTDKDAGTKRVQAVLMCAGILPLSSNFSSEQAALQYYFQYLKVPDITAHKQKKTKQPQPSSSSSTVRGLERQIASPLADEKILVTQNILDKARTMEANNTNHDELARYAAQQTSKARRFARLLGKADAAILGLSTSCATKNTKGGVVSK